MKFECRQGCMPNQRDIIYDRKTSLQIQVFNQRDELFVPGKNEVHFYGDNFGDILAFETIGYRNESEALIRDAIKWYAAYLGCPGMIIYAANPLY
ncbi:hypothetical protein FW774_12455 [Pedobacter sp. BS3]|uniref:hypothetical protein n=1 Tax=Pedobacter sp. BS3 TaxID=2567937 RepID=UPI0011ED7D1F|nr:hypothetical protein [Pedobacter sp. BS3]TZF83106.1 hypothetical protein FW774_12455 [Pedobacter sp. BS3]